ncbi:MAG: phosphoglucomutase [Verrucomicrobia bacterium]|nr:MAG: phosphoglucomutase [Verrucomicrobiota bacterium]
MQLEELKSAVATARSSGLLLDSSAANLLELSAGSSDPVVHSSIAELVSTAQWTELNDRFFKKLAFGTSGLRGRTIGKIITSAERGNAAPDNRPQFPCVGTNALNFFNLTRANRGFAKFLTDYWKREELPGRPSIVFSHDTRHFAREFAEFSAKIMTESGVDVWLFSSHRPTPELSFAVRHVNATGGVMLTASHNPAHDNGYKAYFKDGDPILEPVATGILDEVNAVESDQYTPLPPEQRGQLRTFGSEIDDAYLARLKGVMLQPSLLEKAKGLKIIYTAIHGTGGVFVPTVLSSLGFNFLTVPAQDIPDGRFPTVVSPNPENASALQMALDLAEQEHADIVIGTDPDCDRMGVAVRDRSGRMQLITGNQIGSLMAWYRLKTFFDLGILTESNKDHAVVVKTFVTTQLQDTIAHSFGVLCVNTLTGFKFIGGKLGKYENALPTDIRARYRSLTDSESRDARLAHSRFFVFGGEESYGYLGADWIRDKDGNGAVVMFAELAAYAASRNLTIPDLLEEVFSNFGVFVEHTESPEFPGADGAQKIRRLVESYAASPPTFLDGTAVTRMTHFGQQDVFDEEGDLIPRENMLITELADGRRFAVRPSGTEPKVKFYFFASRKPAPGESLPISDIPAIRTDVRASIDRLWTEVKADIARRLEA